MLEDLDAPIPVPLRPADSPAVDRRARAGAGAGASTGAVARAHRRGSPRAVAAAAGGVAAAGAGRQAERAGRGGGGTGRGTGGAPGRVAATPDRRVHPAIGRVGGDAALAGAAGSEGPRSEEHTSELQSLMRLSYAVFSLKKKKNHSTLQY